MLRSFEAQPINRSGNLVGCQTFSNLSIKLAQMPISKVAMRGQVAVRAVSGVTWVCRTMVGRVVELQ